MKPAGSGIFRTPGRPISFSRMKACGDTALTKKPTASLTSSFPPWRKIFGWTDGVFLELLRDLPPELVQKLASEQAAALLKLIRISQGTVSPRTLARFAFLRCLFFSEALRSRFRVLMILQLF